MLVQTGSPIADPQLDEVERSLGLTLPAAYRAFLLSSNGGGTPDGAVAFFGVDTTPKRPPPFLAAGGGVDVPPETLPIAQLAIEGCPGVDDDDQPRGKLLLVHRGSKTGEIYFWNEARWTTFLRGRLEEPGAPTGGRALEAMFAQAYADRFATLVMVAPSFPALLELAGGTVIDARPMIDEADVARFETRCKLVLPPAYRGYLLVRNGGWLDGGAELPLEPGVVGRITSLHAIHRATPQPADLRIEHTRVPARIPAGTLPIAAGKGPRLFLLDLHTGAVRAQIGTHAPTEVAASLAAFVAAADAGAIDVSPTWPARPPTEADYRGFVRAQLDDFTPALIADLQTRIFPMELTGGATSLDFEVFVDDITRGLPIVGYQMNGARQVMPNVAILPDKTSIIPGRLFEPFRGVKLDDEEALIAELVMRWFVDGWRAAGGATAARWPASIMLHDGDERVDLRTPAR